MMAKQARGSLKNIMSKFGRILNIPVLIDKANMISIMGLPGLAYKDFTRAGIPAIWEVLRIIEVLRIVKARYPEYMLMLNEGPSGELAVVSAQTIHLTRAFYDKACIDMPITYTTCPGRKGKRTYTIMSHLREKATGKSFVEVERQFAFLDSKTKQVVDMPESLRLIYEEHGMKDLPAFHIPVPARPEEVFTYSCKVRHSDTDQLYHANQSVYVKYCMDCAATAQDAGFLPQLTQDIMASHVDRVAVLYKAESFMNDGLDVVMWPDETSPHTLHFQVHRDNAEIVFCTISFYEQDASSKL